MLDIVPVTSVVVIVAVRTELDLKTGLSKVKYIMTPGQLMNPYLNLSEGIGFEQS